MTCCCLPTRWKNSFACSVIAAPLSNMLVWWSVPRKHSCTNALTQLEMTIRDEPAFRFKIPHKGIIENQKESMPRETEKH